MEKPVKRLAGPALQVQLPAGRFAGRETLIAGLAAIRDDYSRAPEISVTDKEGGQILASRCVLEAVMEIMATRAKAAAYAAEVIRQAQTIVANREAEGTGASIVRLNAAGVENPTTRRGVLEAALARAGIGAEVVSEEDRGIGSIFMVKCNTDTTKVAVTEAIMNSGDPVQAMADRLPAIDIGRNHEDRKAEEKARRRASRPPTEPLGLDEDVLDARMVTFDGELRGPAGKEWVFSYLAEGIESTFTISSNSTGSALLELIDEKLDDLHTSFDAPYPEQVLGAMASSRPPKAYLGAVEGEVGTVARALDMLVADYIGVSTNNIPVQYRKAYAVLCDAERPRPAYLTSEGMRELKDALDSLDHPVYTVAREAYGKEGVPVPETREEMVALIQLAPMVKVDICDAALMNMAEAYGLLNKGGSIAPETPADARKGYFKIAFLVRNEIEGAIASGSLISD